MTILAAGLGLLGFGLLLGFALSFLSKEPEPKDPWAEYRPELPAPEADEEGEAR